MPAKPSPDSDQLLVEQLTLIAQGLGKTFAPFCEVVVHDLRDPANSIVFIENNLSGRSIGDPTTELGLARVASEAFEQVIANYANTLSDGRRVKSTSIGIKGSSGKYIAALCLNVDLTLFSGLNNLLSQFSQVTSDITLSESLDPANADGIRERIDAFAARRATSPRGLTVAQRRELVKELKNSGYLELRRSTEVIAQYLGVSRGTIYADAK